MPAKSKATHSFVVILDNVFLCFIKRGKSNKHPKNIRYITMTVDGASDNFTKIADNDIHIMVTTSKLLIVLDFTINSLRCLKFPSIIDILHIRFYKVKFSKGDEDGFKQKN